MLVRIPKASNAATGQYYGVLNIVDDDWGTYTTSKIKVYSVVSDADEDTKSVVFTATCIATQVTNPGGGNSPYYNTTTSTWWQYSDTLKAFEDTGVGNIIHYITKNVQHLKDGTGNGSVVTCLDDEISANNIATGLCSTSLGRNNSNQGDACVALGDSNLIHSGVSNCIVVSGGEAVANDIFVVGDGSNGGHNNKFRITKCGQIYIKSNFDDNREAILQNVLDGVIKDVAYNSATYKLDITFYSGADNYNKQKTYDLSGLKAVLKDDAVKEISVNQSTAVMTVNTINGSSQQIQLPTSLPLSGGTLTGNLTFSDSGTSTKGIYGTVGGYDYWRLVGGATANDSGWLELATANDGTEPIYVRQYGGIGGTDIYNNFGQIIRTATLLDASGNTSFPGTVTASAFSGNAATATKATQDGNGNVITSTYLPLAGGALTGNLMFSNSGTSAKGIYGTTGGTDGWRLVGGATANDSGWVELATADDGTEPIYVSQYKSTQNGTYDKALRTATLLDASGNTSFPGTVTASGDIYYKKSVSTADISSAIVTGKQIGRAYV